MTWDEQLPKHLKPQWDDENGAHDAAEKRLRRWTSIPCLVCGELDFTWGEISSEGGTAFKKTGDWLSTTPVAARACNLCGHIAHIKYP